MLLILLLLCNIIPTRGGDALKRRDLITKLKAAGYKEVRYDGSHTIYKKDGCRAVQIPRHKELNEFTTNAVKPLALAMGI